jgi:hypothetical protein
VVNETANADEGLASDVESIAIGTEEKAASVLAQLDGVEEGEGADGPGSITGLLDELAQRAFAIGPQPLLTDLINNLITGERRFDLRRALIRIFSRRTAIQEGRTGAQLFARAVTKQIEAHCEAEAIGLSQDEREIIVVALAEGAARELLLAADCVARYAPIAISVNRAKEMRNHVLLAQGRANRTRLAEEFKERLVNVCRAIVGEATNE